jgi:hypothetical protein
LGAAYQSDNGVETTGGQIEELKLGKLSSAKISLIGQAKSLFTILGFDSKGQFL